MTTWKLAQRTKDMAPGVLQEILRLAEDPQVISLAGGLPAPQSFPIEVMTAACNKILKENGGSALQYSSGEGYAPLREWVANDLKKQNMHVSPDQIVITTGSQQGLDLAAKVLIDQNSRILVEKPTYLGALQAFLPMQPCVEDVESDEFGPIPASVQAKVGTGADAARFMYVLPNFQNPTGRFMPEERRQAFAKMALECQLPIIEDNPYGELWYDAPPPASLSSRLPEQSIYLSSFSKVLAPGLRLGYMVLPPALLDPILFTKMASDLHTPSLNQRLAFEAIKDGFLDGHIPTIRALYRSKKDAMITALNREMAGLGVRWTTPMGGMFLWLELPASIDTLTMLPKAIARRMAYVPGMAFYAGENSPKNHLRLSYVTATFEQIDEAIAALAATIKEELAS